MNKLMLCQIKYDLTGIEISPEYWYRMRFTGYKIMKPELDELNNNIVKDLKLNPFLKIN